MSGNVAAWAASVRGLESPPSSAAGDWNRPALDVRQTVWDMRDQTPLVSYVLESYPHTLTDRFRFFLVDGTVDLDSRFFMAPNGVFYVRHFI